MDESEVCNVCQEPVPTMVKLSACKHIFCMPCLRQWSVSGAHVIPDDVLGARLSTRDPTCPICRERFHFSICFAERQVQTAVLDVRDSRRSRRTLVCPACQLEFQSTGMTKDKCPGCHKPVVIQRQFESVCPSCQLSVKTNRLFEHAMACIKVTCPACQLEYSNFDDHVRSTCPQVPVTCCAFTGAFADVQEHIRRRGPLGC